jgi:hypothetical protein
MDSTKSKLQTPEVKTGIAQIKKIAIYRQGKQATEDYIVTFRSHKWEEFNVYVNGSKTTKTDNNPDRKSRMNQLGLGNDYTEGDYVEVSVAKIVIGTTGYKKGDDIIAHTSSKGRKNRLEIININDASEIAFNQAFTDFIATEYENNISEKIKNGWNFEDSLNFFSRKHRDSKVSTVDK